MEYTTKNENEDDTLIYDLNSHLQRDNINSDYRNSNFKFVKIYFEEINKEIVLKQDYRKGKGGIFWDGSMVLTKILYEKLLKNEKNKLNLLELGAGTSLPSLFCHHLGHRVTISDIKGSIEFIQEIVDLNRTQDSEINVACLSWEKEEDIKNLKTFDESYDVIIGSELIYLDEYFDDLINVIKTFSNKQTSIILSYKVRVPEMVDTFFNKFSKFFEYYHIEDELVLKYYPLKNKLKLIIAKLI